VRYAYTIIPLGFGIWLAHYGFHFLTGALSIVPAVQRAASDLAGWALLGVPQGQWTGLAPSVVLPMELGVVVLGVIGSLALVHGIARGESVATPRLAAAPWTTVVILLGAVALWLFAQPMDMRGMNMEMGAGDGKGSWAMDARGARLP
jgi:hypothetical protein